MTRSGINISRSKDEYLRVMYELHEKTGEIRITDIAHALGFSKPSANRAVNKLTALGYLRHEPYSGVLLTEAGIETGKLLSAKHETVKKFLIDTLGISEEIAESDAARTENYFSDDTVAKMRSRL